ncbi:MAG: ATP-binding protein [Acidobacteriota bacterium]|nr:ATP-binding protein [Acidobacteriota bacterium]
MRVSSKIGLGSAVLLVLLIGVLIYQVGLVRRTVFTGREVFANQLQSFELLVDQARLVGEVENSALKLVRLSDPGYADKLAGLKTEAETGLKELQGLDLSDQEREEAAHLALLWGELWRLLLVEAPPAEDILGAGSAREAEISETLREVERQVRQLVRTNQAEVAQQSGRLERRRREAERISLGVVVVSTLLILLIVYLTVRSIREPLHQLTEGTRAVAEGRFTFRLDAERNDEFSGLAAAFNSMVERLSKLDQLKKDFVAHVSHELKNPLVAMHETNQLLLEEIPGPLTEKQRRLLDLNVQSGRRLSSMLSNLLDLSSLEAGAMTYHFQVADVGALAALVVGEFEARARERRLRLTTDVPAEPVLAVCDRGRLIQVLENLVDNGLKYTPPGGTVTVGVRRFEALPGSLLDQQLEVDGTLGLTGGPVVLLSVMDTGPGVADELKGAVFEKFHRVESGQRAGGVGLGLAICREIVEAHHGAVGLLDAPSGGSCFWVLLPPAPRDVLGVAVPPVSYGERASGAEAPASRDPTAAGGSGPRKAGKRPGIEGRP